MSSGKASPEQIARYQRVEAHITAALNMVRDAMPEHDRVNIEEYLSENELGIALVTFLGSAREDGWTISEVAGAELDEAAVLMGRETGQWQ